MKSHHVSISGRGQNTLYRESLSHAGHHLRIEIKTDSVPSQGHARIEILGVDNRWTELAHIPPGEMQTAEGLGYRPAKATAEDYADDRNELAEEAIRLLAKP
jgi:hypothetical protein